MNDVSFNGKHFHVAIIGGGASGTLSAIQLLKLDWPVTVHLFNDEFELGRGMAYSAPCNRMVLNVPARNMSAFCDRPHHFVGWLQVRQGAHYPGDAFVPRQIYGDYLRHTLQAAADDSPLGSLRIYNSQVTKLQSENGGYVIGGADEEVFADAVILALGNGSPACPHLNEKKSLPEDRFISNPWKD